MSARPLHILYLAPFGMRHKTTVWARILPLARHLVQRGVQCTVLVPPWDSPEDGGLAQNLDGIAVVQVNVQGGVPAISARLLLEIALRKPDIVHCVKPRAYAGIVQWMLWQRRRLGRPTPRILLDLDDWEQAWQAVNRYPAPVARFLAWQEEWGIRHADAITVASRWLESRAHDYAPQTPILYLPNGVELADPANDTAGFIPHDSRLTFYDLRLAPSASVLWFTRFVEVAPAWFAAFAAALFDANPNARLVIAGTPLHGQGDLPFRAAMPPEYAERVSWLGYVPPESLPAVYAASSVAIFPADATILQMAKCSVRLATTLLAGVPVVASAVGEQANFGAEGASILAPADATPQEFAAQVNRLLADPERRQAVIAAARAHLSAHYRWSALSDALLDFYKR